MPVLSVCEAEGFVYAASQDKTVTRWCISNGTLMRTFKGGYGGVGALATNANAHGEFFAR